MALRFERPHLRNQSPAGGVAMKISESDFRRLHWKSRKLDEVCRIIWPEADEQGIGATVYRIANVIGEYRPGPLRTVDAFIDGEKVSR